MCIEGIIHPVKDEELHRAIIVIPAEKTACLGETFPGIRSSPSRPFGSPLALSSFARDCMAGAGWTLPTRVKKLPRNRFLYIHRVSCSRGEESGDSQNPFLHPSCKHWSPRDSGNTLEELKHTWASHYPPPLPVPRGY